MTDKIAVVNEADVLDEAYSMGYERFADVADMEHGGDESGYAVSHFKETAIWANNVAPSLRALSGMADGGHGTYQKRRDVAVIPVGSEDDVPAEASRIEADYVYDAAVNAFDAGAYDALEGNERGESDDETIL
jgi:hypothetical protein